MTQGWGQQVTRGQQVTQGAAHGCGSLHFAADGNRGEEELGDY